MRFLLDTHVLVWLVEGLADLGAVTRAEIDRAASGDGVLVSGISFWEVAMLERRGRLTLSKPVAEWRRKVLGSPGLSELPVSGDVGIEAVHLPGALHADPADRLIAATCRIVGATLVTRDQRLLAWAREGHVAALPA